jgi:HAE1 family hydrophobic/amphiphilic exporter-1
VKIVNFSVNKPVTIAMIFLAAVVFGFVSLDRLNLKLLPEISYPTLTVQTEYPDAAPMEVENFVTRPLEESVGVISGLRALRSVSKPGMSEITLEFTWKTPMDYAALDVRDKVDLIELPRECNQPIILRYDPSLDPIMRVGIYGTDNLIKLRYIADRTLKRELESLEGVASAKVLGGLEEEIQIELDERKLALFGVPITQVSSRLLQDNVNQSGGRLRDKGAEFLLRTENEFKNVDEIRNTIVREQDGKRIILSDLGAVRRGFREREIITRIKGREAVEVSVYKEGDANTVEVANAIKRRLDSLASQMPKGIETEVLFDQSRFIKKAIGEVRSNAILGAIFAVIVLFFFLRDLRSTFIIGLSIPISIMTTFVLMRQLGVSLNLMSLGGLALGVGMLVDNSIVVLENISRHKEKGLDRREATVAGAGEVGKAVIASTLTTVAVFLPIVFVEGIAGQVFKDQALTVSVSLLASLIVAIMLIPMISSLRVRITEPIASIPQPAAPEAKRFQRLRRMTKKTNHFTSEAAPTFALRILRQIIGGFAGVFRAVTGPFLTAFGLGFKGLEQRYLPVLKWTLDHRFAFLAMVFIFFVASVGFGRFIGRELIPQFSQGEFSFNVRLPEGSPLDASDRKIGEMESFISSNPAAGSYFSSIGQASRLGSNVKSKDKNVGQLNVIMKDRADRKGEEHFIASLRERFDKIEGMTYKFSRPMYFTFQTPIEVDIYGYNLEMLKDVSDEIMEKIARIPGIKDVKTSMEPGNPELNIVFDRVRLSSLGLSLDNVSALLKNKIQGEVPTKFKEREQQVDIRVRTSVWRAEDVGILSSLVVGQREGTPISLGTVADIDLARGLSQITRISQQRVAVISGNITGRDLGSVSEDIRSTLAQMRIPPEVTVELGGQNEELLNSYRNLRFAMILAIFLVYLVMASQFESFLHPFIILFTVPMGAIGVIWMLYLTGNALSVVVLIGAIMLAGIVVNNGIVLIDYINRLRRRGVGKQEAIVEGGRVRLRPIIMTTMTTVLALLPMALGLGEGSEIRAPMALTVIGGLLGATALTLLVIPALYSVVDRGK